MKATKYAAADEDTSEIAKMVARGLRARGHEVVSHAVGETGIEEIEQIKADCIFNLIEWCGLDIALAERAFAALRRADVPVTGSSERVFVLTGDKIKMKRALQSYGVKVAWGVGVAAGEPLPRRVPYPVIVKPHLEHCSIGLSPQVIANGEAELAGIVQRQIQEYEQAVLIEEFIPGRELLVYLVEDRGKVEILPIVEMMFEGNDPMAFQTYDAKWTEQSQDYQKTYYGRAKLSKVEKQSLVENCLLAFRKMGFWGYARFDVRMREGVPYILETNANPSVYDATEEITEIESEVIEGIKFPDYLQKIVEAAVWHYERGERV